MATLLTRTSRLNDIHFVEEVERLERKKYVRSFFKFREKFFDFSLILL